MSAPIKVVQGLLGGELPPFDTIDEANELIGALVMGLWNRLTRHQDRASPFRLTRVETAPTREALAALALMQRLHTSKPLHRPLASSKRLVRILRPIVEARADLVPIGGREGTPLGQRAGSSLFVSLASDEMGS